MIAADHRVRFHRLKMGEIGIISDCTEHSCRVQVQANQVQNRIALPHRTCTAFNRLNIMAVAAWADDTIDVIS